MFDMMPQMRGGLDSRIYACEAWFPYQIPRGARLLHVFAMAGGGRGGNGHSRAAGSAGGGGAGGSSGAYGTGIFSCNLLPTTIYFRVGRGGRTGSIAGGNTVLSMLPEDTTQYNIMRNGGGGGGGNGSGTAGGTAGAQGTAASVGSNSVMGRFGFMNTSGGASGGTGGAQTGANGSAVSIGTTGVSYGGAGGAGCTTTDFTGGAWNGDKLRPTLVGGASGGGRGADGYTQRISGLYVSTGGSGGGSLNGGTGGAGGNGGPGCGGGGGGAGVTGGQGGDGGDGFIFINPIY